MGAASSSHQRLSDESDAMAPTRYGDGDSGKTIGVFYHSKGRPSVVTVFEESIELYNPENGDRRLRVIPPATVTSADYIAVSILGGVLLVGSVDGCVYLYDGETMNFVKRIVASARDEGVLADRGNVGFHVTALRCLQFDMFQVGLGDGKVLSLPFLGSEATKREFQPPDIEDVTLAADAEAGDAEEGSPSLRQHLGPVVGLASYGSKERLLLAAAHKNGVIHNYDMQNRTWLGHYTTKSKIAALFAVPRFHGIAALLEKSNMFLLWDVEGERSLRWDIRSELESIGCGSSVTTCATFCDDRSMLFTGTSDGSVFIRVVRRIEDTDDLTLRLQRYFRPSTAAGIPRPLGCIWFDGSEDALFTGDVAGIARMVPRATGISGHEIREAKREAEREVDEGSGNAADTDADAVFASPAEKVAQRGPAEARGRRQPGQSRSGGGSGEPASVWEPTDAASSAGDRTQPARRDHAAGEGGGGDGGDDDDDNDDDNDEDDDDEAAPSLRGRQGEGEGEGESRGGGQGQSHAAGGGGGGGGKNKKKKNKKKKK